MEHMSDVSVTVDAAPAAIVRERKIVNKPHFEFQNGSQRWNVKTQNLGSKSHIRHQNTAAHKV